MANKNVKPNLSDPKKPAPTQQSKPAEVKSVRVCLFGELSWVGQKCAEWNLKTNF